MPVIHVMLINDSSYNMFRYHPVSALLAKVAHIYIYIYMSFDLKMPDGQTSYSDFATT